MAGGVLAGLKRHEQHVERLGFAEIENLQIVPQSAGCLNIFGLPPSDLIIMPKDKALHASKWTTLAVDFRHLSAAVKIACYVYARISPEPVQH